MNPHIHIWTQRPFDLSVYATHTKFVEQTHKSYAHMRIRSSWNKLINHTHICAYDFRGTNSLTNFFLCVHMIWVCVWFVYGFHKLSMSSWYSWTNHTHIRISFMCAYDMSTRMVCLWVPRTVYEFVVLIDKPYAHTNFVERTLRQIMRTNKRNLYE